MVNNWSISMLPAISLPFCVLAIFSSKKRQQGIDSHTSATAIQFHLGWISETTHFFILKDCVFVWKITHITVQVSFFIETILFSIIIIYESGSTPHHLQNLHIFTHITKNAHAVSQDLTDGKNGALYWELRWAAHPYPMK